MKEQLLNQEEQKELLQIAREAIVYHVNGDKTPQVTVESPALKAASGCFVCIKQNGRLRGCIGNFVSDEPLYRLVQEMAVSAATKDPRFYPMKSHDLDGFDLEISVLSPLEKIDDVERVQVGTHGLYIIKKTYHGVLLPQVATEYGWDRETFLRQTCLKAGLPENAWQKECDIFIFSAQIINDKGHA